MLDLIRRINNTRPEVLFYTESPSVEYLRMLAYAGVLRAPGQQETDCYVDRSSGEVICCHSGDSSRDCRLPQCQYRAVMRARIEKRVLEAYARKRQVLVVRS